MYSVIAPLSDNQNGLHLRYQTEEKIEAQQLDQQLQKAMDSIGIPGISIAIVNQNQIVYNKAFGVTSLKTKVPVTKNTVFEAASLSKPLFAYFLMQMAENGQLDFG